MGAEDDDRGLPAERTEEELEERQERESQELEEKAAAHVEAVKASSGKGKKAKAALDAAEREVDQWQYDMRERHREELEQLLRHLKGEGDDITGHDASAPSGAAAAAGGEEAEGRKTAEQEEAERVLRKKEKAQKKRQGRAAREAEREADREREKMEAGPSARALELAALLGQLARCDPPLRIVEVAADGHCLYRAVADQLQHVRPELHKWARPRESVHEEVRSICAASLLGHPDTYAPFAELKDGEDFKGYCGRVELSGDWGGELELRALADALRARILVHRAGEAEPLELGKENPGAPLQLTYHRHYYSLGEHYNSTACKS